MMSEKIRPRSRKIMPPVFPHRAFNFFNPLVAVLSASTKLMA